MSSRSAYRRAKSHSGVVVGSLTCGSRDDGFAVRRPRRCSRSRSRERTPRWKEVAHPSKRIWMHHLEIDDAREVDERVVEWLRESYESDRARR
ncbi:MAG: DUF5655 domain-containing protein [Actinomycetota bacterium]